MIAGLHLSNFDLVLQWLCQDGIKPLLLTLPDPKGGRRVEYEVRNLPDFPDEVEAFKAAGLMQAPIVESPYVETFSGNNINLVKEIIAAVKAAEEQ